MQSTERQIQFSVKQDGVITCFMSLVLLLILALVSVTLESARVAGVRFLKENCTRMAVNSVMAEYSGALFDRYHLFALNSRTGTVEGIQNFLEARTEYYINRNLQSETRTLWGLSLKRVETEDYELLAENNGAIFRNAAVKYMKYRGTASVAERMFSSLGMFRGAEETIALLEEQAKTEELLADIDYCVLELFETVDGFVRDETGIKQNLWGKVKVSRYFVKKLLEGNPTAENARINHPELFAAVRPHYVNPEICFANMKTYIGNYESAREQIEEIDRRLAELQLKDMLLNPELKLEQTVLETDRLLYAGKKELARQQYLAELYSWETTVSECQKKGRRARDVVKTIRYRQELARGNVLQYEEKLLEAAKWLDPVLYEELAEGLHKMKQYVGLETDPASWIPDMDLMERTLEENCRVLSCVSEEIKKERNAGTAGIGKGQELVAQMETLMESYSHDGLCFDYSGIYLRAEGESPVGTFRELLMSGLASLVLEHPESVSQGVIDGTDLPSGMQKIEDKNVSTENLLWMDTGEKGNASVLGTVNGNSPISEVTEWLVREGETVANRILFLSYLAEHFANYEINPEQNQILKYEQEYILCGNAGDEYNLYEIIGRILLVRLIFNLIHVLGDTEKTAIAGETATALLGVTGLPILVSMMKFMLLFVWAVDAALVETAAILQGKKIALIPVKNEFPVTFPELLGMTGARIRQKAEHIQEKSGAGFGYSEYLMLFLLLQDEELQSMRALDLIQENLSQEEEGFRVRQLVSSFSVQTEFLLPELFTGLPFSKRRTGGYSF